LPRALWVGALSIALAAIATLASAQTGGVRGRVVDDSGKPVPDAQVVFSNQSDGSGFSLKTDSKGEFLAIGKQVGDYTVKATKGPLSASMRVHIGLGDPTVVEGLTLRAGGGGAASSDNPEAAKKKAAELQAAFKAAQADADAGKFDEAIASINKILVDAPKCTTCYVTLGMINLKKGDNDASEAALKKALEVDPNSADAYAGLASLYNAEKKFDDASKASAKASELMAAAGTNDPIAAFNQGVILWNQGGKAAEAQVQFQKATELDPKMADAYYFLGMTLVNQGKMPDAKKPFDTYMQLAPTGKYADQVKNLLALIK
jgi:tetratricopeptide (TPR) repeat protein